MACWLSLRCGAPAQAQDGYPSKAITLVVPVPPGGAADFIARLIGQKLSDALGQPVVISNRGGASGTIASDNVAKSPPDGYTLLVNSITTHGIGPHLNTSLPYDSVKDFTPIIFVANLPLVMTINAGHPDEIGEGGDRLSPRPIPASSRLRRPATAARRICRANCSRTSPASRCCTCLIAAAGQR